MSSAVDFVYIFSLRAGFCLVLGFGVIVVLADVEGMEEWPEVGWPGTNAGALGRKDAGSELV